MGMDCASVIEALERLAPPSLQASWDCSGLQVASTRKEINRLAVCLDATPELLEKALDMGCDFILAHHPLALRASLPNRVNAYWRILRLLLTADVPLYSAHTSLDVNIDGPAGFLGRALELRNCEILDPVESSPMRSYGYGQMGFLPEPEALTTLAARVMQILNIDVTPLCGLRKKDIVRGVAYCGGSGSSLAARASAMGADIFITGDVKYHTALEAEICIMDVGHFAMENEMMRLLARDLAEELNDVEIVFLSSPDPFQFIYRI